MQCLPLQILWSDGRHSQNTIGNYSSVMTVTIGLRTGCMQCMCVLVRGGDQERFLREVVLTET